MLVAVKHFSVNCRSISDEEKKVLCHEYLNLKLVFAKTSLRLHVDAFVLVNGTLKGFEYTLFAHSYTVN
jgi:hypothetical protein